MNIDEAKQLVVLAYKLRAHKLRYKDLFIQFPIAQTSTAQEVEPNLGVDKKAEDRMPTEDELLFWSTDTLDFKKNDGLGEPDANRL